MATILVIDDVPALLFSVKIVLQGAGHKVTSAGTGALGLDLLKGTIFDLVITDIWMPGSGGQDVIRKGRTQSPTTRFMAITGGDPNLSDHLDRLHREDYGADLVLSKPFEKAQLLEAVSRVLAAA